MGSPAEVLVVVVGEEGEEGCWYCDGICGVGWKKPDVAEEGCGWGVRGLEPGWEVWALRAAMI